MNYVLVFLVKLKIKNIIFNNYFLDEFQQYMTYCRSLKFDQKPDYSYLRQLFKNLFYTVLKLENDHNYDWVTSYE